jgi:tRNA 2-thiouridine synthesizing protein A
MSDTTFDSEIMEFQKELDARGLNCPLPILKAKKALAEMATGEVLRIVATDSGSVRDFQALLNKPATPCCRTPKTAANSSF